MKNLIEASNAIYDQAAAAGQSPAERVRWTEIGQRTRYVEIFRLMGELDATISILDVGCGNGGFIPLLLSKGFQGTFTGVDINLRLLTEAKQAYPHCDWIEADILVDDPGKLDVVTMSGLFNVNVGQDDAWCFQMIRRMSQLARRRVVFNAITTHVNFIEPEMYYLDPGKTLDFIVENIGPILEISHHRPPYNYTVAIILD